MTSILGTDLHALVHKANEEEPIPSRPISKAEKQNAKKKRRKARDRETHAEGLIVPDDDHIDQVGEFNRFSSY